MSTSAVSEALPVGPAPAADVRGTVPVVPVTASAAAGTDKRVRVPLRVHPDTKERVKYWASKQNLSANEYIVEAIEEKIRRENSDYDLPTLEIARLGQILDQFASHTIAVNNLHDVVVTGFDSLMGLTRGDNYLLDDEDGELGETGS